MIWKKVSEQTLNNADTKYALTIPGGRQRHSATSTRESLSGANLPQQHQAAARSSGNRYYCYEYRHFCCRCLIRTGYANTCYLVHLLHQNHLVFFLRAAVWPGLPFEGISCACCCVPCYGGSEGQYTQPTPTHACKPFAVVATK